VLVPSVPAAMGDPNFCALTGARLPAVPAAFSRTERESCEPEDGENDRHDPQRVNREAEPTEQQCQ
jgi:hypothetical protein